MYSKVFLFFCWFFLVIRAADGTLLLPSEKVVGLNPAFVLSVWSSLKSSNAEDEEVNKQQLTITNLSFCFSALVEV